MSNSSTPLSGGFSVVRKTWLSRRPHFRSSLLAAWSIFILILTAVLYWKNVGGLAELMPASGETIFEKGQFWRLWTALFAHADLGHLASNAVGLFVLGYLLMGYFSLWFYPLTGVLIGGLTNYLTLLNYNPETRLVGISGVVYWMGGSWLILYLLLDQQRTWSQRLLRVGGVALGVFFPSSAFDPSVSYLAHFYGFILGLISGGVYYVLNRKTFLKALIVEQVVEDSPSENNLPESSPHHPHKKEAPNGEPL